MINLGGAHGVHDKEGCTGLEAVPDVLVVRETAHVVDDLDPHLDDGGNDFGSPGIGGEDGGPDLMFIARLGLRDDVGPVVTKPREAFDLLCDGNGLAIGAGAFGADVDEVGAFSNHLAGSVSSPRLINFTVSREGVVVDIENAHHATTSRP